MIESDIEEIKTLLKQSVNFNYAIYVDGSLIEFLLFSLTVIPGDVITGFAGKYKVISREINVRDLSESKQITLNCEFFKE